MIPQSVLHPGSAGDAPLRVALLGGFGVAVGDEPLGQFGTPRLQSLVAYPLMHRAAPHLRQHLAFLLWPDSSEAQARTNLRNLLHRLTTALPEARRFLDAGSVAIRLRPGAPLSVDVAEFETNLARAAELEHSGEQDGSLDALEAAVALYRGELLPGLYDDWIVAERERLGGLLVRSLRHLVDLLEERREYRRAIDDAEHLLRQDQLDETSYRRLMRLHAVADDRTAVRRVYESCIEVLSRELSVEPARETREIFEQLCRIEAAPLAAVAAQPARLPLVGRQREWRRLRLLFDAPATPPRLVLVAGEAGIGKTRLCRRAAGLAPRAG